MELRGTLLEGNIRRELVGLALPLLIGNVLQQLYNTMDSLIIGRFLGTEAFSAVGVAGTIMNLIIFVLTGFCTGISILFGQMYGSGDKRGFRREVFVAASLGAAITLGLSALFLALMRPMLALINTPAELTPLVRSYLNVIIGGMLCTYFYNLCSAMLSAIGDTRASTFFLAVAVAVNTFVDWLFVGKFRLGIAGAAWATVMSQLLSAVCCLCYILRRDRDLICTRYDLGYEGNLVRRTLAFGSTSALHMSSLYLGKFFVQGAVNLLGTPGIAAFAAASRIEGFANSFGTSQGQATAVFVSQNQGAGNRARVREGFREAMQQAILLGLLLGAALFFAARPGVRIFLDSGETEAIGYGAAYLRQIGLFYVMCFTGNTFVGLFRGTGKMYAPLTGTTLHIAIRAALSYLWVGSFGLRAVALATGTGWVCMTLYQLCMTARLRRRGEL